MTARINKYHVHGTFKNTDKATNNKWPFLAWEYYIMLRVTNEFQGHDFYIGFRTPVIKLLSERFPNQNINIHDVIITQTDLIDSYDDDGREVVMLNESLNRNAAALQEFTQQPPNSRKK